MGADTNSEHDVHGVQGPGIGVPLRLGLGMQARLLD